MARHRSVFLTNVVHNVSPISPIPLPRRAIISLGRTLHHLLKNLAGNFEHGQFLVTIIILLEGFAHRSKKPNAIYKKASCTTAKAINEQDGQMGRQVWYQHWDSKLSHQTSYLARLKYVHRNAVHHGLVDNPQDYAWCSANWFERSATPSFVKSVNRFKIDSLGIYDEY